MADNIVQFPKTCHCSHDFDTHYKDGICLALCDCAGYVDRSREGTYTKVRVEPEAPRYESWEHDPY